MRYDIGKVNLDMGAVVVKESATASLLLCFQGGEHEVVPLNSESNLHKIVQHLKYGVDNGKVVRIYHLESLAGAGPKVVAVDPTELWASLKPALIEIQG